MMYIDMLGVYNCIHVLRTIARKGPVTKAKIASETGTTLQLNQALERLTVLDLIVTSKMMCGTVYAITDLGRSIVVMLEVTNQTFNKAYDSKNLEEVEQ